MIVCYCIIVKYIVFVLFERERKLFSFEKRVKTYVEIYFLGESNRFLYENIIK